MTDQDLEALWPSIVAASRRALRRREFVCRYADAEDVAADVALALTRYEKVTANLIAAVARNRVVDLVRSETQRRVVTEEGRTVIDLGRVLLFLRQIPQDEAWPSMDRDRDVEKQLAGATARQRQVIRAVLNAGSFSRAAKRLNISRQAITQVIQSFRKRKNLCLQRRNSAI